jgi:hypothetical protein
MGNDVPHNRRVISAADGQALQTAQQIMDSVRSAYQAEPDAMLIADATLNPLELIVVDGQSGWYFRVPVTSNDDGTFTFGDPIPVTGPSSPNAYPQPPGSAPTAASWGVISARDRARIQAAVDRGAVPRNRAAFWEAKAAAGEDISQVDQLVGGLLDGLGTVAASAAPRDTDAEYPEYRALFGPPETGQRVADDREVAARAAVAALTDDQVFESMFGKVSAAAAPVTVAAAGPASQHGQGEAAQKRYRVKAPFVTLRVPDGVAAGTEPATTSWRVIALRGGDLVPEDAHPDDVARLRQQKTRLGPLIKPW